MRFKQKQEGITLLITLLLMGVLLGVSTSLLNITLKQYQLSGIAFSSEVAFQAANAGLECILFHDFPVGGASSPFSVNVSGPNDGRPVIQNDGTVSCMGASSADVAGGLNSNAGDELNEVESGEEQRFEFTWGGEAANGADDYLCSKVSIYKFAPAEGTPVSVTIDSKAYRVDDCPGGSVCTVVQARGYNVRCDEIDTNARVVEREYTQVY